MTSGEAASGTNTFSLHAGLCGRGSVADGDHLCTSMCKVASALEEVGPRK